MSYSATLHTADFDRSTFVSSLAGFCRRWFASETIRNPHALDEIGLGHMLSR